MGGDLASAPDGPAGASFLVAAIKEPFSGSLDRIQIINGWLDADGSSEEKIFDVVSSDDRKPGADGKLRSAGATVDVENAAWTNLIGAPELITVWQDLEFDLTPRWPPSTQHISRTLVMRW